MSFQEYFIMMGLGGLFLILGIGAIFWGRSEKKGYYDSIATRTDVREYFNHSPERPGLGALQVGGWIILSLGLLMIIAGGVLWLRA